MADGYIEKNKIEALRQQISLDLISRPIAVSTVTNELSFVRTGDKAAEVLFPVPFCSNEDKPRNGYEEIGYTKPEVCNFSCKNREWAPDGEAIQRGTMVTDLYGIFEQNIPTVIAGGQTTIEHHTAAMLGLGESSTLGPNEVGGGVTPYDGLPFFATNKLINPNRPKVGTFANFDGALNLDRAGLVKMLDYLDSTIGPDGKFAPFPGYNVIVVTNEDQWDRASTYLHGTTRAAAVGTGGASESNIGLLGRAKLVKLTPLKNYNKERGWYGFRVSTPEHRPLVVSVVEPIYPWITGLNPEEWGRTTRNVIRYGRRGRWGHGYLWPQLAFKAIEK